MSGCVYSYMATSGADRKLKLWDLRTLKELCSCPLKAGAGHMMFSQRTLLACAVDRQVEVSRCLHECSDGVMSVLGALSRLVQ